MSGSGYQDNAFPRYVPSSTIGFFKVVNDVRYQSRKTHERVFWGSNVNFTPR